MDEQETRDQRVLCCYCMTYKLLSECILLDMRVGPDLLLYAEYLCEECNDDIVYGEEYV